MLKQKILDRMIDRMDQNSAIVSKYMNGPEFQEIVFETLARKIYDEVRQVGRA